MEENNKIIQNIKTSMQIENCILSDKDINLMNSFLNNEISESQAVEKIKSEFLSME